jgi:integrase/recombinase XerD
MKLQAICERYAAFRKTLGERFETNGRQLKAFCRAMGPNIDIAEVSPEKVNTFLVGKGLAIQRRSTILCTFSTRATSAVV